MGAIGNVYRVRQGAIRNLMADHLLHARCARLARRSHSIQASRRRGRRQLDSWTGKRSLEVIDYKKRGYGWVCTVNGKGSGLLTGQHALAGLKVRASASLQSRNSLNLLRNLSFAHELVTLFLDVILFDVMRY